MDKVIIISSFSQIERHGLNFGTQSLTQESFYPTQRYGNFGKDYSVQPRLFGYIETKGVDENDEDHENESNAYECVSEGIDSVNSQSKGNADNVSHHCTELWQEVGSSPECDKVVSRDNFEWDPDDMSGGLFGENDTGSTLEIVPKLLCIEQKKTTDVADQIEQSVVSVKEHVSGSDSWRTCYDVSLIQDQDAKSSPHVQCAITTEVCILLQDSRMNIPHDIIHQGLNSQLSKDQTEPEDIFMTTTDHDIYKNKECTFGTEITSSNETNTPSFNECSSSIFFSQKGLPNMNSDTLSECEDIVPNNLEESVNNESVDHSGVSPIDDSERAVQFNVHVHKDDLGKEVSFNCLNPLDFESDSEELEERSNDIYNVLMLLGDREDIICVDPNQDSYGIDLHPHNVDVNEDPDICGAAYDTDELVLNLTLDESRMGSLEYHEVCLLFLPCKHAVFRENFDIVTDGCPMCRQTVIAAIKVNT